MRQKSIFTTLFTAFLSIIIVSIGSSALYSLTTFENFIKKIEVDNLIEKSEILYSLFPQKEFANQDVINNFTASGKNRLTRITMIDKDGNVLADSMKDTALMDNHLNRPEVLASIDRNPKAVFRYSDTLGKRMIYYSIPLEYEGQLSGFLRTSTSVEQIDSRIDIVAITISIITMVLIFIAIGISSLMAIKFSVAVNSIKKVASYYAKGEFNIPLAEKGSREFVDLSKSINIMGRSLQERIFTADKQRNRYKSMLESMGEPVIRVNKWGVVEEMNNAAETLFKRGSQASKGLTLLELTGSIDLSDFIRESFVSEGENRMVVKFQGDRESHLQVHSTTLYDGHKGTLGLLLVFNDLTEHIRLENMRKEFVANVSHELRTPTTAIQGYVETLLYNDLPKEQLDKFLGIIQSHSYRLNSIIEDLLVLAGLEKSDGSFTLERFPLSDLISSVVSNIVSKAEKKNIIVEINSPEKVYIYAHPLLTEQALINLLINAIKYSRDGSRIEVKTYTDIHGAYIEVSDEGCGIPIEDQEQVFERFYRVDRARSRGQGGTGLGLSIVKRVMDIHGGEASLESELNKGSTFTLFFPIK